MMIYLDCFDSHLICLHGISLRLKKKQALCWQKKKLKVQTWDLTKAALRHIICYQKAWSEKNNLCNEIKKKQLKVSKYSQRISLSVLCIYRLETSNLMVNYPISILVMITRRIVRFNWKHYWYLFFCCKNYYFKADFQPILHTLESLFTTFVMFHVRGHKMQHFASTYMK